MSGYGHYHDYYEKYPDKAAFFEHKYHSTSEPVKWINYIESGKFYALNDPPMNTNAISSYKIPPNYELRLWHNQRSTTNPIHIVKAGEWTGRGENRLFPKHDNWYNHAKLIKIDTREEYKFKCCANADPNRYKPGLNPDRTVCSIYHPDNKTTCDTIVENNCKKSANKNRVECRCFNPQVPDFIRNSLEKTNQTGMMWAFDNVCTGSTRSYKPSFWRGNMNITLNDCSQIINVSDNKNLLMSNNEFNQYCGGAMTEYQKKILDQLTNLLEENNINVFNDFTEEEVITYNNCVKQINENADSSCVEININPIISKVKERKEMIKQNIANFTKLPSQYGIQDSDLPSMGEYSMMDFNNCRTVNIPNGDFQCITDFENYFKQVQQKKFEAREQAELLKQQQQTSSIYDESSLGSYTIPSKSTTEVPDYQPDTVGSSDVTPTDIINALEGKEPTTRYQQPSIGSSYQQPSYQQPSYQQPSYQQPPIESESGYTTYIIIGVLLILLIVIFVLVIGTIAYGSIGGAYEKVKNKLKSK